MKCYFFEGNLDSLPEIVVPHNHRYNFTTVVHAGRIRNRIYWEHHALGEVYDKFDYHTPLLGGKGFEFVKETHLLVTSNLTYSQGESYCSRADDIHTLQIVSNSAVAILYQYEDRVPADQPTKAYSLSGSKQPSVDGLYDRFSADEALKRIETLNELGVVF
jgi:hypothetical protein